MRTILFVTTLALAAAACSADAGSTDPGPPSDPAADATTSEDGEGTSSSDAMPEADSAPGPDASEPGDVPAVPESDGSEEPVEDTSSPVEDVDESGPDGEVVVDVWADDAGPGEEQNQDALLLCHILCDEVWSECGGYGPYGTDQDSCVSACQELAEVSLDSLVGLGCMAESCDEALCDSGDVPFPIQPQCETACDLFDACGLLGLVQPEYPDSIMLCLVECSASFITTPEMVDGVAECLIEGLQETCDPVVLEGCFGDGPGGPSVEGPTCEEICDIAVNFTCPPWESAPGAWSDPMACLQDCQHYEEDTESSPHTLYGCALSSACQDLEQCATPPAADDPGCAALCTKTFQVCGDDFMPSAEFCTDYCTGQLMAFGSKVSLEDANLCLTEESIECDVDPYANMFACLLQLEDECTTICEGMDACMPDDGQSGIADCQASCNAGYMNLFGSMSTADLATCFEQAAGDCMVQDACLQGPQPPPCYSLCMSGGACETDPDLCITGCEATVADGGLADVACELVDTCKTPGLCDGLDVANAPAECVDACNNASDATCGDYEGGCLAACQGLYLGSGAADPLMPMCMAAQLGPECALESAYWSCVQF